MDYNDILYDASDSIATITIAREHRLNAFTARTVEEMLHAFRAAWADRSVACVILTGAGERAFCAGGDQKEFTQEGRYGTSRNGLWEMEDLHLVIRNIPKPVIAAVNGYAIGGGHVLQVLCDVSIAADHATFGQAGPRVGSFDAGWGAAYLAHVVGQKRAREIWFFCRQYTAETAERWGLVNKVVPMAHLRDEARAWGREAAALGPSALRFLKHAFNADTAQIGGLARFAEAGLDQYLDSPESQEGRNAFVEKRAPNFDPYR